MIEKYKRVLIGLAVTGIPAVVVLTFSLAAAWPEPMPDFRAYEAGPSRKSEFFEYMRPIVVAENERVLAKRKRLVAIAAKSSPGWLDRRWLSALAADYKVDADVLSMPELIDALLRRVDAVPTSLALAQAAKESGWGTSRFARDGNNLFGEWCFENGCGLVPKHRSTGRRHEVEAFESPRESVVSYLRNLNTHERYQSFRVERARLREAGKALSGSALAEELAQYSERRDDYVQDIKSLIQVNKLADGVAPVQKEQPFDVGG